MKRLHTHQIFCNENLPLIIVLLLVGILYLTNLTKSPLWFDEVTEYFYSKTLTGAILWNDTQNMYERIIDTFQPPLYNVMLWLWLKIGDGDAWVRLFSMIFTLFGGIAIYKTVNILTCNNIYSSFITAIYFLLPSIAWFALECSEYNLMLSMVAWSIYYCVLVFLRPSKGTVIKFMVFAVLAVYSQYGAALIEIVLYIGVAWKLLKYKDRHLILTLAVGSILIAIFAALPLIWWFLLPQFEHQAQFNAGSQAIPHGIILANKNIFVDLAVSPLGFIAAILINNTPWLLYVVYFVTLSMIAYLLIDRKHVFSTVGWLFLATWIVYYLLVATSFYGLPIWGNQLGTNNIGKHYSQFMLPLFVVAVSLGLWRMICCLRGHWQGFVLNTLMCIFGVLCVGLACNVYAFEKKNCVREIVDTWLERSDLTIPTYALSGPYREMIYYIDQASDRRVVGNNNEASQDWSLIKEIYTIEPIYINCEDMAIRSGLTTDEDYYFVMSTDYSWMESMINILDSHGYKAKLIKTIENKPQINGTSLYRFTKQRNIVD